MNYAPFYRPLGSTGLTVSALGLGTVKFGRNVKVKNACGDNFALPSDHTLLTLLDTCIEQGVNFLDTAPAYGTSEERLGRLLGHRREEFIIVSKTGEEFDGAESTYSFTLEDTRANVHRSLKRLKTDRLECVLVHCHRDDSAIIKDTPVLETLAALKEKGDILSYGVSTMSVEGGLLAAELCDVVMVSYNVGYTKEFPVIARAAELGKGVIIKKGFCSGFLPDEDGSRTCLDAILARPEVSTVTVGTTNQDHLRENILIARTLTGQEMAETG